MTFERLGLCPTLLKAVDGCGYTTPTPIQGKAIPPVLGGKDVMGLAQTGTGKTAAFLLPIIQRLKDGPRGRVRALIVAPTRELAGQINDAVRVLGKGTRLKSVEIYGGVGMGPQINKLRAGVDIVVACPGRLLDHIGQRYINLSSLEVLVIDEADRMFDMGFLPDIRRIIKHVPAKRQSLLFSATMPPDIRKLVSDILTDPVTVQVDFAAPAKTVSHMLYPVRQHLKAALLKELLSRTATDSVLIFTRTKHRAKKLADQLERMGHCATSLQGNLTQNKRQAAITGFKNGEYKVMVATDIAARGIDVSQISHVINFDMPDTADTYTHRIGRTGRAAKTGEAYTLVTADDTAMVNAIERMIGSKIPKRTLEDFDYAAPAPARTDSFNRPDRPQRPQGASRARTHGPSGGRKHGEANPAAAPARGKRTAQAPYKASGRPAQESRKRGYSGGRSGRPSAGR